MKKVYLRTMALACAFAVAACGGGGADLPLTISPIYGLTKDLTVRNNGGTPVTIAGGSTFYTFTDRIGNDKKFNIEIVTQPSNATCTIVNGSGTTGAYAPQGIAINCIATPHNVSASVSGLNPSVGPLIVVNGKYQYTIKTNGTFPFTTADDGSNTQVGDGNTYGFVILSQPNNGATPPVATQTCTLLNGSGTMADHDVSNLTITCV